MSPQRKSFYVYGQGISLDQLCLGHLVLRDYANPLTVKHCTFPRMTDEDLEKHAYSTDLAPDFNHRKVSGFNFAPGIDLAELVTLEFASASQKVHVLSASGGRRIVLKDPRSFFVEHVIQRKESAETLYRWLSALSWYKAKVRPPKIWLLTGLYALRDAKATIIDKSKLGFEAGISAAVMEATAGVPAGPSLGLEFESGNEIKNPTKGELVWAAQYQQVKTRDVIGDVKANKDPDSTLITLYESRFSKGTLYASGNPEHDYSRDYSCSTKKIATVELQDDDTYDDDNVVTTPDDVCEDDRIIEDYLHFNRLISFDSQNLLAVNFERFRPDNRGPTRSGLAEHVLEPGDSWAQKAWRRSTGKYDPRDHESPFSGVSFALSASTLELVKSWMNRRRGEDE